MKNFKVILSKTRLIQIILLILLILVIRDSINDPNSFIAGESDALNLFK